MPRRGENIYKRTDGRWEGRYIIGRKPDGRAKYASTYGKSYAEVKARLAERKEAQPFSNSGNCSLTVKELFAVWLDYVRAKVKESSHARYVNIASRHILPHLGKTLVRDLTAKKLDKFVEQKILCGRLDGTGGLSDKSVNDIVSVLKSALKYACKSFEFHSTALDVQIPSLKKRRIETFGDCETALISEIVLAKPDISNISYLLCLNTGIRLGEICALRWSDIDFKDGNIRICRTVQRINDGKNTRMVLQTPKSATSERIIPLTTDMLHLLACQRGDVPADNYVLTGTCKPMEPRTMQYRFKSFLQKYNFRVRNFHILRHSFATRCIARGMDAKCLSELLGHSSVKTTLQLYVHPSMEQKRALIQAASTFALGKAC